MIAGVISAQSQMLAKFIAADAKKSNRAATERANRYLCEMMNAPTAVQIANAMANVRAQDFTSLELIARTLAESPLIADREMAHDALGAISFRKVSTASKNSKRFFSNNTKWVASLISTLRLTGALVKSRINPSRSSG